MKTLLSVLMIATAMPAAAQTVADGSVDDATAKLIVEWLDRDLRDPLSAQFRKVRPSKTFGRAVLCGDINQKNEVGGYVGFRPFWADLTHKEAQLSTLENDADFQNFYPDFGCD